MINFRTKNQGVDLYAGHHFVNNFYRAAYASRWLIVRSNWQTALFIRLTISDSICAITYQVPWPTCLTLFAGSVGLTPSPTDHPPTARHCFVTGGCSSMWMLCQHHASCSNFTPSSTETLCVDLYAGVKFWTFFDV